MGPHTILKVLAATVLIGLGTYVLASNPDVRNHFGWQQPTAPAPIEQTLTDLDFEPVEESARPSLAKGFVCNFSGGLDYELNDAFAFKSTPARPQSFKIIVRNFSVRSGNALFGSDQETALDEALVSNLGGAFSFFVEHGRGVTVMTIFAKKEPSSGKFYAAFTEHFLSPLVSGPNMYIVTGTCSADPG